MSNDTYRQDVPHGFLLVSKLFFEYLSSSSFGTDVSGVLLKTVGENVCYSGNPLSSWRFMKALLEQITHRFVECCVLATFAVSNSTMLHRAATLHLTFPSVQHHQFTSCWITQAPCSVAKVFIPSFLWTWLKSAVVGLPSCWKDEEDELLSDYYESVSFYGGSYASSVIRSVIASSLVTLTADEVVQQAAWASLFYKTRDDESFRWPLLKQYLCFMAESITQTILVVGARILGAGLGRLLFREPNIGFLFWSERLAVLAAGLPINKMGRVVWNMVHEGLEEVHPTTEEERQAESARGEQEASSFRDDADSSNASFTGPMMVSKVDHYAVLGVGPTATTEDIKRAYHVAALENHPDRVPRCEEAQNAARERMAAINQAYETLSSQKKRSMYDLSRRTTQLPGALSQIHNLSTATRVGIGVVGLMAGVGIKVTILYAQYYTSFLELTGLGKGPLRFLGIV
uniref:Putative chaperone protein DNAj n=1 Tax=Trypanosoma congolense (strain IL3000) TaxID=1068625 RepID=G0UPB3_TRYCI|nr:putative chaperone protein DNAj [Trypanosoma congolense IL3000]